MNSSIKDRIASFAIVWCMVFSLFAGLLVVAPSSAEAALPSFLENGDVIIGSDYTQSTWTLDLNGGTHYMDGNLTISGTLTLIGTPGHRYSILATTNFIGWEPVCTNASPYTFVDTNAGNFQYRFYRGRFVP